MNKTVRILLYVALLIPGAALLVLSYLVGPYVLDDQQLDAVVMAVALDWRDFGKAKAEERLQFELDKKVGLQVGDDACALTEDEQGKHVRCAWAVRVPIPAAAKVIPLSFASDATIAPDGDLR